MDAKTTIKFDIKKRTVWMTMTGIYDEDSMRAACAEMRAATQAFRGQDHIYLADMRGMKPTHPNTAALLGEAIGWSRRNGVVLCAHVSDDTVQRLQAARVARQTTPGDNITVDVSSLSEAERVLVEARERLLSGQGVLAAEQMASASQA